MNNRRKLLFALGASALAAPFGSYAQQPSSRIRRIGYVGANNPASAAPQVEALRSGLRELGYTEGKNLVIEFRWTEGRIDPLPEQVAELVRLKVDVIITTTTSSTRAAMKATNTIPILMVEVGDPLGSGLVASLARPGGNVTGFTQMGAELTGKRLQMLKETVPKVSRVAFLWNPTYQKSHFDQMQAAAKVLSLTLQSVEVRDPSEFDSAFSNMMRERPDALIMTADSVHRLRVAWIVEFAAKRRLPAMYQIKEYVEAGGLMSYGANLPDLSRRSALYVDKILKGAKPAELPVEQPTKFEMVINMKTAKALGIKIPNSILVRADKVIE